jgi:uncharacterized Zn-binding protein involved in type VI secretion
MSKKKSKPQEVNRRKKRAKYIALLGLVLGFALSFGAVFGRWRNLPVIRNLVSPVARVTQPVSPPTIPPASNPSKEYIYGGGKLIATEAPKLDQAITFNPIADKTYGDAAFSINGTASSGLTVSFTVTSGPASVSGSILTLTGAGTVSITAAQTGDDSFNPAQPVSQTFQVAKGTATVTLSGLTATFDGAAHFASATTSPLNLNIGFVYSQGGTNVSSPTNAGSYTVNATVIDNNYQGGASGSLSIAKAGQTISFNAPADKTYGAVPFAVSASSASGLPVSFAIQTGPATVSGSTITINGAGSVMVRASQGGNSNFDAAADVDRTFNVAQAAATIALSNLAHTFDGSAKTATAITNPTGLSGVSITYNGSSAAPTSAGSYTVIASLTNTNYTASNANGTLVISPATATITVSNLSQTYDGSPKTATATTNPAGLTTVSLTYNGSSTAPTNAGSYAVIASLTNANYTASNANGTLIISPATATIALSNLSQIYDGSPKTATATTNPAGLTTVSLTYNGSTTAPTNTGSYAVVASLTNANYTASNASGTLVIGTTAATIALGNLNQTYDGTPRAASATTNPAGLTVISITYNGSSTVPTNAGSYAVVAHLTNAAYSASDATGTLLVAKATPAVTWNNPADIVYGTALSSAQLNATASLAGNSVAGTFSYTPGAGTVLTAGNGQLLSTMFTPADSVNYNNAPGSTHINVTSSGGNANGYGFQRSIIIDHTKVPNTDQNNFPVLISGTYAYLATTTNGGNVQNANGYDVIFTSDSGCATKLNHEVETYNATNGAVNYWVRVPNVSHTTDSVIYMCYGSSGITSSQENRASVWDTNYKGVWHLPNGTSLTANDSTSNGANGTLINSPSATTGRIAGGASFNSALSQYLTMGNALDIGPGDFTLEAWIKPPNATQFVPILGKRDNTSYRTYAFAIGYMTSTYGLIASKSLSVFTYQGGALATNAQSYRTTNDVIDGNWHHVVAVRSSGVISILVDGSAAALTAEVANTTAPDSSNAAQFGISHFDGAGYYNGLIDEARISFSARSADWIATEYNNQNSPATFYTISSNIAKGIGPGVGTNWLALGNSPLFPFDGVLYTSNFMPERRLFTTSTTKGL